MKNCAYGHGIVIDEVHDVLAILLRRATLEPLREATRKRTKAAQMRLAMGAEPLDVDLASQAGLR